MLQTTPPAKASVVVAVCLAALVLPLSFTAGAVATPAIGRDLGGGPIALTWITNAFMLTFGSFLLAAGGLADRFGRKVVFCWGVAGFAAISVVIGLAPSIFWLDALRGAQGLAAAVALAGGTAALAQEVEGPARTRAFSLLGTTFGTGLAFGPLLAGWLVETVGWRSVFLSTAAIGAAAFGLGLSRLRETRDPAATGLDWPGLLTFSGALALFTCGILQAPSVGWGSAQVLTLLLGSAALLTLFAVIERRTPRPLLDLSLFRDPVFAGVQLLPVATCCCYVVLLVLLPLRFIGVEGAGETQAGLLMIALSAPMLVVPSLAARLTRWVRGSVLAAAGLAAAAAGLVWLGRIAPGQAPADVVAPMLLIGLGTGLPWGLMDGLSVSVAPKDRAGMATGIFSTVRVAGEGISLALVGALLAALAQRELGHASILHAVEPARLAEAGRRLAAADLSGASARLGELDPSALAAAYGVAFQQLCHVLAAITLACSLAVLVLLRRERTDGAAKAAGEGVARV